MAHIIRDFVIPHTELHGLYHVSSEPINKYELLCLIANEYSKKIIITPDDSLVIDRSLDSSRFTNATGYKSAPWAELVHSMRKFSLG